MGRWVVVCLAVGCQDAPATSRVPPDWTPVPLAHLSLPPDTPCAEGVDWLYGANCTGQEAQPICQRFAEAVRLFVMPAEGIHCDPVRRAETQALALRLTQRSVARAPADLQADPRVQNRVHDQRLWLLDGFVQAIVERAAPRPGKEAAAGAFRARYRPTDFSQPLPR